MRFWMLTAVVTLFLPTIAGANGSQVRTGRSSYRTPLGNIPIVVKLRGDAQFLGNVQMTLNYGERPIMRTNVAKTVANSPRTTSTTLRATQQLSLDARAPFALGGGKQPGPDKGQAEIIVQTRTAAKAAALREHLRGSNGYAFDDAVRRALKDATERW